MCIERVCIERVVSLRANRERGVVIGEAVLFDVAFEGEGEEEEYVHRGVVGEEE